MGSLERMNKLFGGSSSKESATSASTGNSKLTSARESAERVAKELDEYLVKKSAGAKVAPTRSSRLTDDAVADLQLITARKIREVCCIVRISQAIVPREYC